MIMNSNGDHGLYAGYLPYIWDVKRHEMITFEYSLSNEVVFPKSTNLTWIIYYRRVLSSDMIGVHSSSMTFALLLWLPAARISSDGLQ